MSMNTGLAPADADCFLWQTGHGGPDAGGIVWIEASLYAIADLVRLIVTDGAGQPIADGAGKNLMRANNLPDPLASVRIEGLITDSTDAFLQNAYTAARAKLAEAQTNQAAVVRVQAFANVAVLVPRT